MFPSSSAVSHWAILFLFISLGFSDLRPGSAAAWDGALSWSTDHTGAHTLEPGAQFNNKVLDIN